MPLLDHAVFLQTFNRLAVALRESKADSAMQEVYFKALEEFPSNVVSQSALMLAQQPDRRFFPTTGEWVSAALTIRANANRKLMDLPERSEPWVFECDECEDTGWKRHECEGNGTCGRNHLHAPHPYVTVCPCRTSNRTYMRHHASA